MKPIVLFRKDINSEEEYKACEKYFKTITQRSDLDRDRSGNMIIGRYSVLPFYHELEKDINYFDNCLINPTFAHNFIANFEYYGFIKDYTF